MLFRKQGFTLVELAIVIVIIGLLVGGVLAGQELVKQAQYRTMMKAFEGYKTAVTTFKAKYSCLPGDCPNAYNYFASNGCGANIVIGTSNPTGCNGNGDGILSTAEGQILWSHLSYAKLITGSFTTGYKSPVKVGTDVPSVPIGDSVGISALYAQSDVNNASTCGYQYCPDTDPINIMGYLVGKNIFYMGNVRPNIVGTAGAFLTPSEAMEFDTKFDDGKVFSGPISGHKGRLTDGSPGTCTPDTPPNGLYCNSSNCSATYKDKHCIMVFDMGN